MPLPWDVATCGARVPWAGSSVRAHFHQKLPHLEENKITIWLHNARAQQVTADPQRVKYISHAVIIAHMARGKKTQGENSVSADNQLHANMLLFNPIELPRLKNEWLS